MNDTAALIAALADAPSMIISLIHEVPPLNLKRRPSPHKWSAHEHACHLSDVDGLYFSRLELILSDPAPYIKDVVASPEEETGSLLKVNLEEALGQYARERRRLVDRLRALCAEDWQRTAEHAECSHYSVFIMFRQLLLHEMFHAYRIEELRLKKDWSSSSA